jgi:DNA-binding CsgD family transcriptional regulator
MSINKEIISRLYTEEGLSIKKISVELGISEEKVKYYMRLYKIRVRTKSETAYLQHNKSFSPKQLESHRDYYLYGLGIGLYLGEGNKASEYSVRLGNTDPGIINLFVKFLVDICGVDKNEIKYGLQVFNDSDPDEALKYWMLQLNCDKTMFHKTISVIPPQGKGTYRRKSTKGVLQVYVNNKRLKEWISGRLYDMPT